MALPGAVFVNNTGLAAGLGGRILSSNVKNFVPRHRMFDDAGTVVFEERNGE